MKKGSIVPSEITCGLLKSEMKLKASSYEYFLIDGFPRNLENLFGYQKHMENITNLVSTIVIDIDKVLKINI
jgi:adenylate kinase family enzyme